MMAEITNQTRSEFDLILFGDLEAAFVYVGGPEFCPLNMKWNSKFL